MCSSHDDPTQHDSGGDAAINELIRNITSHPPEVVAREMLDMMRGVVEHAAETGFRLGTAVMSPNDLDEHTTEIALLFMFVIATRFRGRLRLDNNEIDRWLAANGNTVGINKRADENGPMFTLTVEPIGEGSGDVANARRD
jgi:hypothetical protein